MRLWKSYCKEYFGGSKMYGRNLNARNQSTENIYGLSGNIFYWRIFFFLSLARTLIMAIWTNRKNRTTNFRNSWFYLWWLLLGCHTVDFVVYTYCVVGLGCSYIKWRFLVASRHHWNDKTKHQTHKRKHRPDSAQLKFHLSDLFIYLFRYFSFDWVHAIQCLSSPSHHSFVRSFESLFVSLFSIRQKSLSSSSTKSFGYVSFTLSQTRTFRTRASEHLFFGPKFIASSDVCACCVEWILCFGLIRQI